MILKPFLRQSAQPGEWQRSAEALLLAAAFHFPHRRLPGKDDGSVLT
jgi:hypothetical protein